MSRFYAPENSVTERSVRMAFNYEYMVPIEVAWELERELNSLREDCQKLRNDRESLQRDLRELRCALIGGAV